ncbi:DoxX family protein [Aquimarina brevivitae]|uniref:DoxX-like protein n=1 Tax=Aquimarina brevivitae TaxID=323412 RepID=A0A4Q7PHP5_9FLAO|nr:DoxX family protein [Aquimarina brevivitae]RZS99320.1 hypothetical protein EV197_0529 [Aquimarina brevivitae]
MQLKLPYKTHIHNIMIENFTDNIVAITILLFVLITFLQSGIDKISDWKGNISWLTDHFASTFLAAMVPLALFIILITELIAGLLAIIGIYYLLSDNSTGVAISAMFISCVTLLLLLFGQRIAKDYQGALTITCYFIVTIFGLYVLTA